MKKQYLTAVLLFLMSYTIMFSQNIYDFVSITPGAQTDQFIFPESHSFQKIISVDESLTGGGLFPIQPDFSGYVPISNSSLNGYLSINSEFFPGGVTILDINFDLVKNLWVKTASQAVNFSSVGGTAANCSGTVTPWNTIISSEELTLPINNFPDDYLDYGWNVEINPVTKSVITKHWAMGNFAHENVTIHTNERTVYQGADSNPGYLYKFVADTPQDLSSGTLYVYSGLKSGAGNWILLANTTPAERNSTLAQSNTLGGTVFNGVEDVEIGPDGMVYFAVKNEGQVYRLQDSDAITGTTATVETFVGNTNYDITHNGGVTSVDWGNGNDNLAFDNGGNLWVLQDGGTNYIWLVENGHTQASPKVKIFGRAPLGSEPTGITFTPDFKYLFMSIMHPTNTNNANQIDADGNIVLFDKGTTVVLALAENLGTILSVSEFGLISNKIYVVPNPIDFNKKVIIKRDHINNIKLFSMQGKLLMNNSYNDVNEVNLKLNKVASGLYIIRVNNEQSTKVFVK